MTRQPVARCPRWCDYADARNHPSNHIVHVGDVVTATQILAITVESAGGSERMPVLALFDEHRRPAAARLSWSEAERLGRLLLDAKRRYA